MKGTLSGGTRGLLLSASLLGLGACATAPAPATGPAPRPPSAYALEAATAGPEAAWPEAAWWRAYGDPQLDGLIEEAVAGAPTLRSADARMRKAEALARQSRAGLLPELSSAGSVQMAQQSETLGQPVPKGWDDNGRATLNLAWDLDLWGRNRAAPAAAVSEAEAARADAAAARLALSTAVAAAYADLAGAFADLDAARDAVAVRGQTADLMRARQQSGLENEGAVQRAVSAHAAAQADLARAEEAVTLGRHRLAALLGAGPDRGLAIARPTLKGLGAAGAPADLAAELIGRRPDVRAARLRAEAAAGRIKVARAQFYPNVNLAAFYGLQSLNLADFTKAGSEIGGVGPAVSLPIFNGGRLRAGLRGAEADYDAVVAAYDDALVQALRETADALASRRALTARLERTQAAEAAAETAWTVARDRYRGGLATYLDVLTAEDALIAARRSAAQLDTQAFTHDVALVRALGGGFRS
ncbi:efflux transporter outer membrane subunit [Phenylobacterium sp.]|uniref:efflux transporter outer membrane subunit n=1 Tax=Phenylobacterium sp. TaxID=1871053 RepID=UPI003918792B